MSRIAYVDGRYVPHREAAVSIDDRAFLFADGVYEVCEVHGGHLVDETRHLDRLNRSLSELRIGWPVSRAALRIVLREVVARNLVREGMVYVEITRGAAPRDHIFPPATTRPTLVVTAKALDPSKAAARAAKGIAVISLPDERWARPDIKSVSLLPNVLARQQAREAGAYEAWLVDANGFVTEGAATNAWIVTAEGTVVTRQADRRILRGVTRTTLVDLISRLGLVLEERPFHMSEARQAREAFVTGATTLVMPVVGIDGISIGDGRPGPLARRLRAEFHNVSELAE